MSGGNVVTEGMSYANFVSQKLTRAPATGINVVPDLHPSLFPFQRDLVSWALRRGRCALFADTGLGKTRMQLEWARHDDPVIHERRFRVVPRAPEPESEVIVEIVDDGYIVSLLRDHGTTVASVKYSRAQLEQFVLRAMSALEV